MTVCCCNLRHLGCCSAVPRNPPQYPVVVECNRWQSPELDISNRATKLTAILSKLTWEIMKATRQPLVGPVEQLLVGCTDPGTARFPADDSTDKPLGLVLETLPHVLQQDSKDRGLLQRQGLEAVGVVAKDVSTLTSITCSCQGQWRL